MQVYRESFGVERTYFDQSLSLGLWLPLNTLSAESAVPGLGGTNSDFGDLTFILKYAVWENRESGNLWSVGLAVTAPTGPNNFAGSSAVTSFHETILHPYLGYIWNEGRVYLHGFSALSIPTDSNDVTLLHNDVAVGYFVYRAQDRERCLTAVAPTFEVHVNTPLNHRGAFNFADPAGTPDWVDLTTGVTFEFNRRSTLAMGIVTPVTGPKPYDLEVMVQLNWRFGASANAR
jgi:hypothetical protein